MGVVLGEVDETCWWLVTFFYCYLFLIDHTSVPFCDFVLTLAALSSLPADVSLLARSLPVGFQ